MPRSGSWQHLEDRLIGLAQSICAVAEGLPRTILGTHITGQVLRSGTSPASNYAEAQGAESRKDFIHRMCICLKELRETYVWLELCRRLQLGNQDHVTVAIRETDELIAIFTASIRTARANGARAIKR